MPELAIINFILAAIIFWQITEYKENLYRWVRILGWTAISVNIAAGILVLLP